MSIIKHSDDYLELKLINETLEKAILNCVAKWQDEGTVRVFGSDKATIDFFLYRHIPGLAAAMGEE